MAYAQTRAAERTSSQASFGFDGGGATRPRLAPVEPWPQPVQLDEELAAVGFYLTGHPLEDMIEVLRRRRVLLFVEAVQRAEAGDEGLRMAGVVRRRQERASQSGGKFAFVTLSDPTGEYEVLFPPESLKRCRDVLEPGAAVMIKVRAKGRDGEVRFFGDDAELVGKAQESDVGGLRVHVEAKEDFSSLKRRLDAGSAVKGGEVAVVTALEGLGEVEIKIPGRFMLDAALRGALKTAPGVRWLEDV
jgi:DNA polymerase-3 subunit alpha